MSGRVRGGFIIAIAIAIAFIAVAQPISSHYSPQTSQAQLQNAVNQIVLAANNPGAFNIYNTNGTPPTISDAQTIFCGSNKTNMYQDIVSYTTLKADKTLVLAANATTNVKEASITGEDQFAIFATDDTTKYKSDEFGFVLPETGNTWYAYIQSPGIPGFFVWQPVLTLGSSGAEQHSFKAIYSNAGLLSFVDFYVDGKLVWTALYPNVSGQSFHMVLSSHKVSAENIDISQNTMAIGNASLRDNSANGSQGFPYLSLL